MMQLSIGMPDWYPPSPYKAPAIVLTVMCVLKSAIADTLFAVQSNVFHFYLALQRIVLRWLGRRHSKTA